MKQCLILVFVVCSSLLIATPRGLTTREIVIEDAISVIQAQSLHLLPAPATESGAMDLRDEWYQAWEVPMDILLPAGEQVGIIYNPLELWRSPYSSLGTAISDTGYLNAVARAPQWIRAELHSVLLQVNESVRQALTELVLNAPDPYVDEIAFCIANSSALYLNSAFFHPQLFLENAQKIYEIAQDLPYVEIIDTGSAAGGGDYWSTTRYWRKDASGILEQLTVPRDIYYWYLVHPKITDEIAAYIDPLIVENNSTHSNNIVSPSEGGKFWRSYIYDYEQDGYPVLADTLSACNSVFNRDGSPGDAIRAITWWINQNMSFTSNAERPHQPVRIFTKRFGRCGEYADLSSAVARIALIPCTNISSISTDHTWNEFWEDGWVSWEPVNGYLNNPLVYENGWGKVFGSVFEERCDGLFTPVTERYSEGLANIDIQVLDANSQPVDGARVVLAIFETTPRFDNIQYTNNNGVASFVVGEGRDYRARAETAWGIYPANPGTYAQLVSNSEDGANYNYQFQIDAVMPGAQIEDLGLPQDPVQDYSFIVSYQSDAYYVSGKTIMDDIDVLGSPAPYYQKVNSPSTARFIVTDADNALFLDLDNFCSAYGVQEPQTEADITFNIPSSEIWYALLDNSHKSGNAVRLSGSMALWAYGISNDEQQNPIPGFSLGSAHPNPFSMGTSIRLENSAAQAVEAGIYNLRGQKLRDLHRGLLKTGTHNLVWDGRDASGRSVASGLYLLVVKTEQEQKSRRLILVK